MPLKLNLKADERVIIGGAVIRNGGKHAAELFIENNVPILREKDIMPEDAADTLAKRIYFSLQLIYIDSENRSAHIEYFFSRAHELMEVEPGTRPYLTAICDQVTVSRFYQALKIAHTLIDYEKERTTHVEPVHSSL